MELDCCNSLYINGIRSQLNSRYSLEVSMPGSVSNSSFYVSAMQKIRSMLSSVFRNLEKMFER